MPVNVVSGAYFRDLMEQPQALAATADALHADERLARVAERLSSGRYRRIVLTGMGSSFHGLVPLSLRLIHAGHAPLPVEASELLHHAPALLADGSLLVVVSQSGRSAEIVSLLEAVRGRPVDVLGVTNTSGSPLERAAHACLVTRAGEEATVSCKTYLAAQAALAFVAAVLTAEDASALQRELAAVVPLVEAYLAGWRDHVEALFPLLGELRAVFYTGRGASVAAAATAGLITKEATRRPAEGMSSAAFRHGPMELLGPDVFVLVFAGAARTMTLNEALVADVLAAGARSALAGEDADEAVFRLPRVPERLRPLVELLPVQMITLALAAIDGREAGRFERAAKVTDTE